MHTLAQLRNGELKGAASLKLSENITKFPEEIFELADTLELLDLSRNQLSALPEDLGRLSELRILFCSENQFTTLPASLAGCPALDIAGFKANKIETVPPRALNPNIRWLILTDNRITGIPPDIGHCHRMQKLMLAGNQLSALPQELSNCRNLSLLRISANCLTELPAWLLSMPKLSWLAFSGNKFNVGYHAESLPPTAWSDLDIHNLLGEGASGHIYKGVMRGAMQKEVAIKVFKGSVTSDGLPEDELHTFIAAGAHEGLVRLIGQLSGHPDGRHGLVMELIPPTFRNLGLPPTFATCTRDVFAPGMTLSLPQVLRIARTITSVGMHLHSMGIMHGDLYAHNTLVNNDGATLFSDFGAASFYDTADADTAQGLERIEVSAFGHMLDDLISLSAAPRDNKTIAALSQLRNAAISTDVMFRPSFRQLSAALDEL